MANESNNSFDCGRYEPMRIRVFVVEEDGRRITRSERRPRGRGLVMVDTNGNTIFFRTTNAISEKSERDEYGLQKLHEKTQENVLWQTLPMIPFLKCPQMTEFEHRLPPHLRTGRRCTVAADGSQIGEDKSGESHPCKCMVDVRAERQAANTARESNRDPKTTIQQAILNNSQETTAKLTELLGQLVAKENAANLIAAAGAKSK